MKWVDSLREKTKIEALRHAYAQMDVELSPAIPSSSSSEGDAGRPMLASEIDAEIDSETAPTIPSSESDAHHSKSSSVGDLTSTVSSVSCFWLLTGIIACLLTTAPIYVAPVVMLLCSTLHVGIMYALLCAGVPSTHLRVTRWRMGLALLALTGVAMAVALHTRGWRYTIWRLGKATLLKYAIKHEWMQLDTRQAETSLVILHDVFTKHSIAFWPSEGTALGLVRERRILPWDDDVDVGIWDTDRAQLARILPELASQGLHLADEQGPYFWKFLRGNVIVDVDMTGPGHYCHAASCPCDQIIPLVRNRTEMQVFNRSFSLPTEAYLVRLYTEDWHIPRSHYKPPCQGYSSNC